MGVSNYTPTGISHATSVDFSKRSVNQPVHIVQYDKTLPILAVSLYNNGQQYRLNETMDVSIRLGKPDRTFVYNKALGCDSTRTIVYFEITQQMSIFDGEYYPVIEIKDGEKIANSSTIYLVVDRNPVQHDYVESTIEYKELVEYRNETLKASKEAKQSETNAKASESASKLSETNAKNSETNAKASESASKVSETNAKNSETNAKASESASKVSETNAKNSETNAKASENASKLSETNAKTSETNAKNSAQIATNKANEAIEASETAVNAANSASESAESILGVEENVTRIGNMVSEKEPIILKAAETASTSATNAKQSETNAKASEEASKLSETNAKASEEASKLSETNAKASETKAKQSETNAKKSENESVKYGNLAKSYAVGTDNIIRENDAEDNAKTYCEAAKTSAGNAKQSETNAKTYLDKIIEKVDVTVDAEMSDTSTNPVQNKVVKSYVDGTFKQKLLAQMPGDGKTSYCQLCTIKITKNYINTPIEITVQERGRDTLDRLNILFESRGDVHPNLISFKVIGEFCNWYISKTGTSTWVIYGEKNEVWGNIGVVDYVGYDGVNVTWDVTGVTALPDSKTKASWGGNVNFANNAGSASSVAWNNVTGKPSTYTPSSHTHTKSQITDFPSSLPANGGNSATVNGHTVNSNVPSNAKFTDTTYNDATTSVHGLMTPDMVTKLNGIAAGANKTVVDTSMSSTSTNPVQNKIVKKYVDDKQVKHGDGLAVTEDRTLKVNVDGVTLTIDQINNVIKLADTFKNAINGALPAANVVNNLTTTEAGFALDARQANPNVDGTLAKQLSDLNGSLSNENVIPINIDGVPQDDLNFYVIRGGYCYLSLYLSSINNTEPIYIYGVPEPISSLNFIAIHHHYNTVDNKVVLGSVFKSGDDIGIDRPHVRINPKEVNGLCGNVVYPIAFN